MPGKELTMNGEVFSNKSTPKQLYYFQIFLVFCAIVAYDESVSYGTEFVSKDTPAIGGNTFRRKEG